jgi:molybdopterin-guanine dinucleotide biosynthesis protein B
MFEDNRNRSPKGPIDASIDGKSAKSPSPEIVAAPYAPLPILPPIVAFVGHSGSGKTTFVEKLIRRLIQEGIRVAVIKHDVHGFEMDKPGKDTWRHKKAGAVATLISSPEKIGLVMDSERDHDPKELLPLLHFADLVITEGFKHSRLPKIEVFRPDATGDEAPLRLYDPDLLALISDVVVHVDVPVFGTADVAGVAAFLQTHFLTPPD